MKSYPWHLRISDHWTQEPVLINKIVPPSGFARLILLHVKLGNVANKLDHLHGEVRLDSRRL